MPSLRKVLELSEEADVSQRQSADAPGRARWFLSTVLVFVFLLAGLIGVVVPWSLCLHYIGSDRALLICLHLTVFLVPCALWGFIIFLARAREPAARSRLVTSSLIGLLLATAIAYIGLLPWALFAAAFRNVRM